MTDEEKKQKLEELRLKLAEKRARKAEEDALAFKANEGIRRKQGKVRAPPCKVPPEGTDYDRTLGFEQAPRRNQGEGNPEGGRSEKAGCVTETMVT